MERTSEISKRLVEFIKSIGKPVSVFEAELGLSNGFVAKTNEKMQKKTRQVIQQAYPQLNIDWLFSGEGEMIRTGYSPVTSRNEEFLHPLGGPVNGNGNNINYGKDNIILSDQRLLEVIQEQQKTISEQSKQLGVYVEIINRLTKNMQICPE